MNMFPIYHLSQSWSWTFSLIVQKLVSAKFTWNGIVNMYRFANVAFKTELVMDFQFNSTRAGKCHVYWERIVNMNRFSNVPYKTELVIDFQFISTKSG